MIIVDSDSQEKTESQNQRKDKSPMEVESSEFCESCYQRSFNKEVWAKLTQISKDIKEIKAIL